MISAGGTLRGHTLDLVFSQRLLVRILYVSRKNRSDTLPEFCARVDSHSSFTSKAWDAATMRALRSKTPIGMQAIERDDLRKVCEFLAHAIRTTPTQTDDAPWYPDGWRDALNAFPGNDERLAAE